MTNYRVDDLGELLAQLHARGVAVVAGPESPEHGKFAWIMDPDGNKVDPRQLTPWDPENTPA